MLDQHIFLNSMCTCVVTLVIYLVTVLPTVPPVPLVSLVSVAVYVRCCSDSGACDAPSVLGVCC